MKKNFTGTYSKFSGYYFVLRSKTTGKHDQPVVQKHARNQFKVAGSQRQIIKMFIIDTLILIKHSREILNCHGGEEVM